jgi:FlaA1/EpsC-like NDP-sugar epimerase
VVGIRPGEKIHEEMITASDSFNTVDLGKYFAILSSSPELSIDRYCAETGANRVPAGYAYNSGTNPEFLTVDQLRALIQQHVTGVVQSRG